MVAPTQDGKRQDVLAPRMISLTQHAAQTADLPARLEYGHAALSVEQIEAGGFDHLALFGDIRAQGMSICAWTRACASRA